MPPGINPCRHCKAVEKTKSLIKRAVGVTPNIENPDYDVSPETVLCARLVVVFVLVAGIIFYFG